MDPLGDVLVLGGGGWVGSALALQLLRRREELQVSRVMVADVPGGGAWLPWLRARVAELGQLGHLMEKGLDVREVEAVRQVFDDFRPSTVFNLAAVIDMRPEVSSQRMTEVNGKAIEGLLAQSCDRFIHFSTFDVAWTGQNLNGVPPKPIQDLQVNSPIGYVRTKAQGELQLHRATSRATQSSTRSTRPVVVLRPAHIFGPLRNSKSMGADALAGFLRKFPPLQLGPWSARMSMVSVPTVIEAAVRAAQRAQKLDGGCFAVKDLDENFFSFYHEQILGRRMWRPLRLPGVLVFFASLVEDMCFWLMSWLPWVRRHPVHCLTFHGVCQAFAHFVVDDAQTLQSLGNYRRPLTESEEKVH